MSNTIPASALDERLGIVGTSGAGKTYTAMGLVERLLSSGSRAIIVDPLDVWWGLRLMADGTTPSPYRLPIFGGAHGDLPLTEHSGRLIGETVATMSESCIVSLGEFKSAAAERRFMLAFLEALFRNLPKELVHLVLDEADLWAPQQVMDKDGGDAMALKGMVNTVVRRGRAKGFIPWMITQRPAVIDKSIMSMMLAFLFMKTVGPQDRSAAGDWIKGQAEKAVLDQLLDSLPTLNIGQGIAWVPGQSVLETIQFPEKPTFDSSRAPKRGEIIERRDLVALDLDQVRQQLEAVEQEIKASDPRALRAEVLRLTRELAAGKATVGAPDAEALTRAMADGYERGMSDGRLQGRLDAHMRAMGFALAELRPVVDRLADWMLEGPGAEAPAPPPARRRVAPPLAFAKVVTEALAAAPTTAPPLSQDPENGREALSAGAEKIVAMLEKVWPVSLTLEDAAKHGGVGIRSSQFPGYKKEIAALVASGGLERCADGNLRATRRVGSAADVLEGYKRQYPPSYVAMLNVIERASPDVVSKASIIEAAGISPTSSTGGAGLAAMVKEGVIVRAGDGYVLAAMFQ